MDHIDLTAGQMQLNIMETPPSESPTPGRVTSALGASTQQNAHPLPEQINHMDFDRTADSSIAGFWPLWMTPLPRKHITEYRIQKSRRDLELCSIDRPFIVLTETKSSYRHIPVWARYSPHRSLIPSRKSVRWELLAFREPLAL